MRSKDRGLMAQDTKLTTADRMQDLLLESSGFPEFLLGLATVSAAALANKGTIWCTITVERNGGPITFAASSAEGLRLDERQYALKDGPCLTAVRQQRLVSIPDLRSEERWSDSLQAALDEGVRSVLALPVPAGTQVRAGLSCYAGTAGAFDEESVALMEQHVASMSRVLQIALRLHRADRHPEHLREALKSRAAVDAAVSLLMLQSRSGRDGALDVLHTAAKSTNRRLQDIADDIMQGIELPAGNRNGGQGVPGQ